MTIRRAALTITLISLGLVVMMWVQAQSQTETIDQVLADSWSFYKNRFMEDGQHVVSATYGGTISEGQSYALLKAVWMDDPETFEDVWQWTRREMGRPNDHLLGWRWGELPDKKGAKGLLETENAVDADQDIAYALLLAGERWNRPDFTRDGRAIIRDLWRLNVEEIGGRLYLTPGTWEGFRQGGHLTVDPSYFAPYVYRKFAEYDPEHAAGWRRLAGNIYGTLEACSNLTKTGLPPNWCGIPWDSDGSSRVPRVVFSDVAGEGARDFGYDAFRVFWRMSMDASMGSEQARDYLRRHSYLQTHWENFGRLPEGFSPDGQPLGPENSGFTLSAALAQSHALDPDSSRQLYQTMLASHYNPAGYWFNDYNDYLHSVIWLHLYTLTLKR